MKCSKCNQELPEGASFCGNCGQQVTAPAPTPTPVPTVETQPTTVVPTQAPAPEGGKKATAAFVLGLVGIVGSLIPLLGLILGILAVIFGSMTLKSNKRGFAMAGLILGIIVIIFSLIAWGYNISVAMQNGEFGMIFDIGSLAGLFRFVF